jgi:hypothetical protein
MRIGAAEVIAQPEVRSKGCQSIPGAQFSRSLRPSEEKLSWHLTRNEHATAALGGRGCAVCASALRSQTTDFAARWCAEQSAVLATELRCALVADAVRSR